MMLAVTDEAKRRVVAGKKYYITYGQHCCAQVASSLAIFALISRLSVLTVHRAAARRRNSPVTPR